MNMRRLRHLARAPFGLALLVLLAAPAAAETATVEGGQITQTGWWSARNAPPQTGLLAPPPPPAPGVPKGSLPVAVLFGQHERMSAIEFAFDAPIGAQVTSVTMTLQESPESGGSVNGTAASIQACPVSDSFFVGGENGAWANRPAFDCEDGAVTGTRDAAGMWTFDLTSLATRWLSSDNTSAPAVMLVGALTGATGQPLSYQVAFEGLATQGIGLAADATERPSETPDTTAPDSETPDTTAPDSETPDTTAPDSETPDTGTPDTGTPDTGTPETKTPDTKTPEPNDETSVGTSGGGSASTGGSLTAGGIPSSSTGGALGGSDTSALPSSSPVNLPPSDGEDVTAPSAAAPTTGEAIQPAPVAMAAPPWHSGMPRLWILLLVLAGGLAYLTMVAMGPTAQPTAVSARRGVSKALDRLRATGTGMAARVGR